MSRSLRDKLVRPLSWMGTVVGLALLLASPVAASDAPAVPGSTSTVEDAGANPEPSGKLEAPGPSGLQMLAHNCQNGYPVVCSQLDPCTGAIFSDRACCPNGTTSACKAAFTPEGCITGIWAVCLIPF